MSSAISARHVPALDGLRALMIVAIVCYHLNLPFLPSGHLGVVIFFVLTGFLVTSSLLRAYGYAHEVDRVDVLLKRFKRIWPSLFVLVVGVLAFTLAFNRVLFTKARPDALPSVLYVLNWSYVLRDISYFDALGTPSPLLHLWYIALSEQFVLIWTLVAPLLFRRGRRLTMAVALALAAVSALAMALLYVPDADPSRVYYGLDTRAFSLLIGAALACVWPAWRQVPALRRARGASVSTVASVLGVISLVALVAGMVVLPADSSLLYRGGMVLVSVLGVGLIVGCLAQSGPLTSLFSLPPLTLLGKRAFALYLWHYPVIGLLGAAQAKVDWWVKPAAVLISLAAAELSYRLVERPFAQLGSEHANEPRRSTIARRASVALVSCVTLALGAYAVWGVFTAEDEFLVPQDAITSTGVSADSAAIVSKPSADTAAQVDAAASSDVPPVDQTVPLPELITTIAASADEQTAGLYDPVLIGDSVPGDSALASLFPNGIIDTYVGRRPAQAIEVYRGYAEQGVVGNTVIFAAFSNTTPLPDQLEELVATVGPNKTIYLVGIVEPYGFQDEANENLLACAQAHDNVEFIDWANVCAGHEAEYLYDDGTHLTPAGDPVYVQMIAHAVGERMRSYGCAVS